MKAVKDKIRFALWLKPETMEKIRTASAQNDCGSLSEFIEKAVLAYLGYLSAGGGNTAFLPGAFLSTMKGIVAESDHRHASMLFKLSVEMAMLMNIVAAFVRSASEIAEQFHIPQGNLRWYAAFHNEKHHPHVHLMIWSEDEKEGYLSERGI